MAFIVFAALLAPAISATVGVSSLVFKGLATWEDFRAIWLTWWLGDASGATTVAPLMILWANRRHLDWTPQQSLELAALGLTTIGLSLLVFRTPFPTAYIVIPLVLWAALRFTPRETATTTFIINAIAVYGTTHGLGPFQLADQNTSLLVLQGFVALTSIIGLFLACMTAARRDADNDIRRSCDELDNLVKTRTAHLTASEARFSGFMQNLPGFAWIKDATGRYVVANPAFASTLGKKPEEVVGRTDFDLFPAEIAREYRGNDDEARHTAGVVRTIEHQLVEGKERRSLVHKFPIPGEGGPSIAGVAIDITDRLQAEEALEAARRTMEDAQRISHVGSWTWDVPTNSVTWSDELYRIFGLPKGVVTYDSYLAGIHPDDRARVEGVIQDAFRSGIFPAFEHRIKRQDGTIRILECRGNVENDAAGKPLQMTGISQDVTEKRAAEETRRELDDRFRAIFEHNPVPMIISSVPDGRLVSVNAAFERVFGWTQAEASGKTSLELNLVDAASRDKRRAELDQTDRVSSQSTRMRAKNGRLIDAAVSAEVVTLRGQRFAISIAQDITLIREVEERFRAVVEASPIGFSFSRVRDGVIVDVNEAYATLFGYTRREMIGRTNQELNLMPEQRVRDRVQAEMGRSGRSVDFEATLHRKDGGTVQVLASTLILPFDGEPCVVGMVRDLTAAKDAEAGRVKAAEQAKEIETLHQVAELKTQFINMAAHELNTPLTPIRIQFNLLKNGKSADSKHALKILERNFDRIAALVANMLDAAMMQSGTLSVQQTSMNVAETLQQTVESFHQVALAGGIQLGEDVEADLWVEADPHRIGQVLYNLVSNALKFTPTAGRVTVSARREGALAVVRVADSGQGMTPEQIEKLFHPFTQVHDLAQTSSTPGSGLGLYISRELVERHGGKIWAESSGPGRGSTFAFTIPVGGRSSTSRAPTHSVVPPPSSPRL